MATSNLTNAMKLSISECADNQAMQARMAKSEADNAAMKNEIAELKAMVQALAVK